MPLVKVFYASIMNIHTKGIPGISQVAIAGSLVVQELS